MLHKDIWDSSIKRLSRLTDAFTLDHFNCCPLLSARLNIFNVKSEYLLKVHSDMKVPDGFENMKDMWASHVSGCTLLHMSGRYKHTINWKHVRAGSFSTDVPDSQRQPIGSSNPITRHQTRPVRTDLMAHTENMAVMVHTCLRGEGIVRMSSNVTMTNQNLEKFQRNVEFWKELECELTNNNQNSS